MLQAIHRQGYKAPNIRRVYIPNPGKTENRPLDADEEKESGPEPALSNLQGPCAC